MSPRDFGGDFDELDELFPDTEDRRLAAILTSVQAPEVTADPAFRSQLRRELMQEAWGRSERRHRERRGGGFWRALFTPPGFAWAGAVAGVVMIALVVVALSHGGTDNTVYVTYNVDGIHPVAAVQPIEVKFSQPMDPTSTQAAVQITPATQVNFQWTDSTTLKITPASGSFAPNTQYTVNIAPAVAKTATGAAVPAVKPALFTVAPTPAPSASPTPSPTPSATPPPGVSGERQLAAGVGNGLAWLPDGSALLWVGADGRLLKASPSSSAAPVAVAGPGVQRFAVSPDGSSVIFGTAAAVSTVGADGSKLTQLAAVATLAVGWVGDKPEYVTASSIFTPSGEVKLDRALAAGTAVALSPDGSRLWYGGHVLDLASKKVSDWQQSPAAFLAWSPDSQKVLYTAADGLWIAGYDGSSPAKVSAVTPASASWTQAELIVYAGQAGLVEVQVSNHKESAVAPGEYTQPSLAPTGQNLGFVRGGNVWSGQLLTGTAATVVAPLDKAAAAVNSFMQARVAGASDQAGAFLDAKGRADFTAPGGPQLLRSTTPKLSRSFTVLSGSTSAGARFVERLVLADATGKDVDQLDETLTLVADPSGAVLVDHAVDGSAFAYGAGPTVLSVTYDGTAYKVEFDSDLTPASVTAGLQLLDTGGKPVAVTPTVQGREVLLTTSKAAKLVVLPALQDKNGVGATTEYDVDLSALS
ncbi:MAG TPA: Ig-like domain-containing protein [Candidatus Dormibacteraeota bacterium]